MAATLESSVIGVKTPESAHHVPISKHVKIDDLLLLADVLDAGSLGAAARRLQLPKATLSRRLAALEASVAQRLFVPGARKLTLTPFGQSLAERAQSHRDELDETRRWIGAQDPAPRGQLRIWVPADLAILLLAEPMARFIERYPEVQLDIDTTPGRADLSAQAYDLVVHVGPLPDSDLVARPLLQLARGLYASPLYLAQRRAPRSPAGLDEHRLVVMTQSRQFPQRLRRGARSVEVAARDAQQTNSIGLVRALVLAGAGLGSFPHGMVQADLAAGRLLRVLPDWEFEPLQVTLLTASRRLMPAKLRAFIDHLAETAPGWAV